MMERSTIPAPFVVKPTNEWDGDDGNWSSFAISVGTPPQYFRVLPSTSSPDITLPVEEGCQGSLIGLPNCGGLRGGEDGNPYLRNNSSTWSLTGLYQVFRQQTIFNETGVFGTDNVTIGNGASSTNATVKTQTVIGQYYNNKLAGSLILGGYDQSKVDSAIVTSPINSDKSPPSIDISVASITASNTLSGSTRGGPIISGHCNH
ncbi:hypothetical protein MRB53_037838 [Persea americana]|nr:hypothetical protein MRB53_037838 [Persea americana]